ncbi:MAG: RNA polymerase sigma factor [Alphaproteobacteria bacterium]|nr:RNA polymerase sigma factor [Alphaproteobacteria bacterium]MCB9796360.1 RNA polymerase sigma factor [Alphaproteobacteria bacterium]
MSGLRGLSDAELLGQVAAGDRAAMGALVERHQAAVYRYTCTLLRTPEAAEDALQQTFIDAMRGAHGWAGRSSVRTWLLTLARNAAYRGARRRAGEPAQHLPLDALGAMAGWGEDPEQATSDRLEVAALRRALGALPEEAQEVIVLRDLEGLTGPETAELLGLTLPALKSRLHRARLLLAATLREEVRHAE